MKIKFGEVKGSILGFFWDLQNAECSFQHDTHQGRELLWLGVNLDWQGNPGHRMLLDKHHVSVLVEILKGFLQTGKVPMNPSEMPTSLKFMDENGNVREPEKKKSQTLTLLDQILEIEEQEDIKFVRDQTKKGLSCEGVGWRVTHLKALKDLLIKEMSETDI